MYKQTTFGVAFAAIFPTIDETSTASTSSVVVVVDEDSAIVVTSIFSIFFLARIARLRFSKQPYFRFLPFFLSSFFSVNKKARVWLGIVTENTRMVLFFLWNQNHQFFFYASRKGSFGF